MGDASETEPVETPAAEETGAREIWARRNPWIGMAAYLWGTMVLVFSLVGQRQPEPQPVAILIQSILFAVFLFLVGTTYFLQPGSPARRILWRTTWIYMVVAIVGVIVVFAVFRP